MKKTSHRKNAKPALFVNCLCRLGGMTGSIKGKKMGRELCATIERIGAALGQRLLVVSDIHGRRDWLIQLLEKMEYGGDDILIIIGDLIEKGPDSLGVVRYVMDLSLDNYVYVSMGNVDWSRLQYFLDDSPEAGGRAGIPWEDQEAIPARIEFSEKPAGHFDGGTVSLCPRRSAHG